MFTPEDVQTRLRVHPFIPIRIVMTTGQTYDIYHPELIIVGRHYLAVGTPTRDNATIADQVNLLALVHITELRPLPTPVSPTGNGPA